LPRDLDYYLRKIVKRVESNEELEGFGGKEGALKTIGAKIKGPWEGITLGKF
jgi:hypothetical protein